MKKNIKILLTCALAVAIAFALMGASPAPVNTYGAQALSVSLQQTSHTPCRCPLPPGERGERLGVSFVAGGSGFIQADLDYVVSVGDIVHVYTYDGYRRHSDLVVALVMAIPIVYRFMVGFSHPTGSMCDYGAYWLADVVEGDVLYSSNLAEMLCLCLSITHGALMNGYRHVVSNVLLVSYLSVGMVINIYHDGVLTHEDLIISHIVVNATFIFVTFVYYPAPSIAWGSTIVGIDFDFDLCEIGELAKYNTCDNADTGDDTNTEDNADGDTNTGDSTDDNANTDGNNYRRVPTWQLIFGAVGGVSIIVLLTLGVHGIFKKVSNKKLDRW